MKYYVRGNKKNKLPMFIEHNNTLITDPNRIANTFNDYFANIGSDLASHMCAGGTMKCINNICLGRCNVLANFDNY